MAQSKVYPDRGQLMTDPGLLSTVQLEALGYADCLRGARRVWYLAYCQNKN